MPSLADPRTRTPQRYVWWKEKPTTPCVTWHTGAPPAGVFVHVGRRMPTQKELRWGGKDAGHSFGGKWSAGVGWQPMHAWLWQHAPEKLPSDALPPRAAPVPAPLPDAEFWRLVALVEGDDVSRLVARLARASAAKIRGFDDALAAKLHALDARRFAEQIGRHAYRDGGRGFSADLFLYARCAAVARGRAAYEAILADPRQMPRDEACEALLGAAAAAFTQKTGEDYEHVAAPDPEIFSNAAGWR